MPWLAPCYENLRQPKSPLAFVRASIPSGIVSFWTSTPHVYSPRLTQLCDVLPSTLPHLNYSKSHISHSLLCHFNTSSPLGLYEPGPFWMAPHYIRVAALQRDRSLQPRPIWCLATSSPTKPIIKSCLGVTEGCRDQCRVQAMTQTH